MKKTVTIADAIRAIENCTDYRTLCRIRNRLRAHSIKVRYKDDPKELASFYRTQAMLKGAKIRL
jgi:hypothetical protein